MEAVLLRLLGASTIGTVLILLNWKCEEWQAMKVRCTRATTRRLGNRYHLPRGNAHVLWRPATPVPLSGCDGIACRWCHRRRYLSQRQTRSGRAGLGM